MKYLATLNFWCPLDNHCYLAGFHIPQTSFHSDSSVEKMNWSSVLPVTRKCCQMIPEIIAYLELRINLEPRVMLVSGGWIGFSACIVSIILINNWKSIMEKPHISRWPRPTPKFLKLISVYRITYDIFFLGSFAMFQAYHLMEGPHSVFWKYHHVSQFDCTRVKFVSVPLTWKNYGCFLYFLRRAPHMSVVEGGCLIAITRESGVGDH